MTERDQVEAAWARINNAAVVLGKMTASISMGLESNLPGLVLD